MERVAKNKWRWAGHIPRQEEAKWTKHIINWRPRQHKRNIGRPPRRWVDDINEKAGKNWVQVAQDKIEWREKEEAYVQEWTTKC